MKKRVDSTAAERAKRYRENKNKRASSGGGMPALREALASKVVDHPAPATAPSAPPAAAVDHPAPVSALHETVPHVVGGGPEQFAAVLMLPVGEGEDAKEEPYVPPPPPPPEAGPEPVTADDVAPFAALVAGYWKLGSAMLLAKFPELPAIATAFHPDAMKAQPQLDAFIYKAAVKVGVKYRMKFKYQDEAVVLAAIGVASFGIAFKRELPEQPTTNGPAVKDAEVVP